MKPSHTAHHWIFRVRRAAQLARTGTAWGVLLLALRFAGQVGQGVYAHATAAEETNSIVQRTSAPEASSAPSATPEAPEDPGALPPEPEQLGPPSPRNLLIDLGPARSEVYVNGRYLGLTPYVGQWNCADGQRLLIQVIPEKGAPLERLAVCGGAAIKAQQ